MAAPPRPSAPWQPAQFSEYRVPNSTTSFGDRVSKALRGWPGGALQPESSSIGPSAAAAHRCRNRFTGVYLRFHVVELYMMIKLLRSRRSTDSRVFVSVYGDGQSRYRQGDS